MTIEIQAPYRLKCWPNPRSRSWRCETYIQAAYPSEFNARIPHFLPCQLRLYRADGVLVGACGLNQACHGEHEQPLYLSNIWSSLSRPPSRPVSGSVRPATASSKWAILPAANRVTPA